MNPGSGCVFRRRHFGNGKSFYQSTKAFVLEKDAIGQDREVEDYQKCVKDRVDAEQMVEHFISFSVKLNHRILTGRRLQPRAILTSSELRVLLRKAC